MCNTEKLIQLVRQRPFLYDFSHSDYKNRVKKAEIWLEIAEEMGTEDGNYWVSKWKILRDNYNKHKKSFETSTAQAYKKYKNWPWSQQMKFLDDYNSKGMSSNTVACAAQQNRSGDTEFEIEILAQEKSQVRASTTEATQNTVPSKLKRKTGMKSYKESAGKITNYRRMINEQRMQMDEVDYYFLSYAKTFKRLPSRMQIMLRLDIATLFARYELQNEDGSSSQTSCSLLMDTLVGPSVSAMLGFENR